MAQKPKHREISRQLRANIAAGRYGANQRLRLAVGGVTPEAMLNLEILAHVARLSGGLLSIVDEAAQLPAAITRVEKDLRTQYLMGFTPTGAGPVRYRRISLRLSGPARPVRVRAGYRGTLPPIKGG